MFGCVFDSGRFDIGLHPDFYIINKCLREKTKNSNVIYLLSRQSQRFFKMLVNGILSGIFFFFTDHLLSDPFFVYIFFRLSFDFHMFFVSLIPKTIKYKLIFSSWPPNKLTKPLISEPLLFVIIIMKKLCPNLIVIQIPGAICSH